MSGRGERLAVDIGGTFTDVVLETPDGLRSAKTLTTHDAPERGIVTGIEAVYRSADGTPAPTALLHGTTLATNALIERRGAHTALITTEGFRDVIEMRTESRYDQYDIDIVLPEPLISREHRFTVPERVAADGSILLPLDEAALRVLAARIGERGYDSVAIGLLHSYANPAHERRVAELLRAQLPEVDISLSSEVSPQMREYERFNTVCANAYIRPLMRGYLSRLREALAGTGLECPIHLVHSGGGLMSLESALEFPVRLVESGPAGGAIFAADIARRYGIDRALSFDMGGTTAKICLIRDHAPKTARVFEVARGARFMKGSGMPISIPCIEMVEIGAGGGSLARVDAMRQLRVGPESAGSEPGPACYGRGGLRPAVTDADLVLGKIDPEDFAGGSIRLSRTAAEGALTQTLGPVTGEEPRAAAHGVAEVVDETMANAARVHAVENGEDLARYAMIAFGGAAPLHAGRLCEKLGIDRLLVPVGAGVGSAIGFLRAPYSFEATRSVVMRLDAFDPDRVRGIFAELAEEARGFVRRCDATAEIRESARCFMRYAGQGWEIPVDLTPEDIVAPDGARFVSLFERHYAALFGRSVAGVAIEATGWSVTVETEERLETMAPSPQMGVMAEPVATRALVDPVNGESVPADCYRRDALDAGAWLDGPALVMETETTVVIPTGFRASVQADRCLVIDRRKDS